MRDYKYPIFSNGLGINALWGFSKEYTIDVHAITFSSIGTLGHPVIRNPYFTPIIRLKVIIPIYENVNLSFLKESISQATFSNNASGIPNINANAIKQIKIAYTNNIKEQLKVGNLFKKVDKLVTLHQRKCFMLC